jgi:hypothetical protein
MATHMKKTRKIVTNEEPHPIKCPQGAPRITSDVRQSVRAQSQYLLLVD